MGSRAQSTGDRRWRHCRARRLSELRVAGRKSVSLLKSRLVPTSKTYIKRSDATRWTRRGRIISTSFFRSPLKHRSGRNDPADSHVLKQTQRRIRNFRYLHIFSRYRWITRHTSYVIWKSHAVRLTKMFIPWQNANAPNRSREVNDAQHGVNSTSSRAIKTITTRVHACRRRGDRIDC